MTKLPTPIGKDLADARNTLRDSVVKLRRHSDRTKPHTCKRLREAPCTACDPKSEAAAETAARIQVQTARMLIFQEADVTNGVVWRLCLLRALRTVRFFQIASSSLGRRPWTTSSLNVTSCSFLRSNAAIDAHACPCPLETHQQDIRRLLTTAPLPLQTTAAVTTYCWHIVLLQARSRDYYSPSTIATPRIRSSTPHAHARCTRPRPSTNPRLSDT